MDTDQHTLNVPRLRAHVRGIATGVAGDDLKGVMLLGTGRKTPQWVAFVSLREVEDADDICERISLALEPTHPDLQEQSVQVEVSQPSDLRAMVSSATAIDGDVAFP